MNIACRRVPLRPRYAGRTLANTVNIKLNFKISKMEFPFPPPKKKQNNNLPVYVELTPGDAGESALLLFRFQDPMALLRRWQIKVTQIRCSSVDRSGIQEHLSARMTKFKTKCFFAKTPQRLPAVPHLPLRPILHLQLFPGGGKRPPRKPSNFFKKNSTVSCISRIKFI